MTKTLVGTPDPEPPRHPLSVKVSNGNCTVSLSSATWGTMYVDGTTLTAPVTDGSWHTVSFTTTAL